MGDAGPPTPDPLNQGENAVRNGDVCPGDVAPLREIKVLVTGFGVGLRFSW